MSAIDSRFSRRVANYPLSAWLVGFASPAFAFECATIERTSWVDTAALVELPSTMPPAA